MSLDGSDEEEEWCKHELIIDTNKALVGPSNDNDTSTAKKNGDDYNYDSDEYWNDASTNNDSTGSKDKEQGSHRAKHITKKKLQNQYDDHNVGEPMFILDVSNINPEIHSKFDRNSVNDPGAASKIRRSFETKFHSLSKDADLLASGTIIPCGTTVWKQALSRMRDERKGHYFVPIFPPMRSKDA